MGTITINIPQDLQLSYHLDRLEIVEQILDRLKRKPGASQPRELATSELSPLEELQNLQTYLERVNVFFRQIQDWFAAEFDVMTSSISLRERGHTYEAPVLTIRERGQEEVLATLKPVGAFVVRVAGLIEIRGWVDRAHLDYMTTEDRFLVTEASTGLKRHTYLGVNQAGWYWVEDPRTRQAYLVDKTVLLKLITLVSDHEF